MGKGVLLISVLILVFLSGCDRFEQNDALETQNSNASIGFIGCSNTRETVEGYHRVGGRNMWDYDRRYGSGTVIDWSKNVDEGSIYWDVFDELLEKYPKTKIIWWKFCIMDEDRTTSYEHARVILTK